MKIWFTSDTFFGRDSVAKERGFNSSDEMDEHIIAKWLAKLNEGDVIYHLGNFSWDPVSAEIILNSVKNKVQIIGGQYDSHISQNSTILSGRNLLLPRDIYKVPSHNMCLCHWPLHDWPGKSEDFIHIHGETKNKENLQEVKRISVHCENWDYNLVDLETIIEIFDVSSK